MLAYWYVLETKTGFLLLKRRRKPILIGCQRYTLISAMFRRIVLYLYDKKMDRMGGNSVALYFLVLLRIWYRLENMAHKNSESEPTRGSERLFQLLDFV